MNDQVKVKAGEPLDQSALLETQRNLYNLALFNEVNAAVQNPTGDAEQKNVLVQLTEAKRWDVTYGFGFEVQTGVPTCGMYCTRQGTTAAQQGKAGASPRVSLDVSRINLRGSDDSITFHGDYGLLEEIATVTFQNPHIFGHKSFSGQIAGGYSNVQDISTFASSTLQGSVHITEKATRKDTFIYDFEYRRVAVNPDSLAIAADLIPLLVAAGAGGWPGDYMVPRHAQPEPAGCGKGLLYQRAGFSGDLEVWVADEFQPDGCVECDVLPVWQEQVRVCAEYAHWISSRLRARIPMRGR